jgi:hypothetical protein
MIPIHFWVNTECIFEISSPWLQFIFDVLPDLLHEVELGVVKSLFIHTLRILEAHSTNFIATVDER